VAALERISTLSAYPLDLGQREGDLPLSRSREVGFRADPVTVGGSILLASSVFLVAQAGVFTITLSAT